MTTNEKTPSAHTPGPWILDTNGKIIAQADAGKWADYICQMPFDSLKEAEELGSRQIANACLIAAAPDLLEASDRMSAAIFDMLEDESLILSGDWNDLLVQIISMGTAAIAKARGEAA